MYRLRRHFATPIVALVCAALAAAAVLWLTRAPGPGLSPDSMSYLAAARALARGEGPRVPFADWSDADSTSRLRDFPPGFPSAIAVGMALGASTEQSARWVMALAAAGSAAGTVLAVSSVAGPAAGLLAAVLVAVAPAFVEQHFIVLSEPLFLALLVALLALMITRRPRPLALGVVSGAAVMVRYAGVALPFAAALWCASRPGRWRERLSRGAAAAGPGAVAFVLWSRWAGGVRNYGWKGHLGPTLTEGWNTLQSWMLPGVHPSVLRIMLTLPVLAAIAWLLGAAMRGTHGDESGARRVVVASGVLASCYAGIVLFSRLVADAGIPFDNRLFSPVFLLVTVAQVVAGSAVWRTWSVPARAVAGVAGILWLAGSVVVVRQEAGELAEDGWGYASADWVSSDLVRWLHSDGRHYALFSDSPPSLYSLTGRPSRRLDSQDEPAEIGEVLATRPSAIVGFRDTETGELGRTAALAARLGYHQVVRSDAGAVWLK